MDGAGLWVYVGSIRPLLSALSSINEFLEVTDAIYGREVQD